MDVYGVPEVPQDFFFSAMFHPIERSASKLVEILTADGHIVQGRWKQLVSLEHSLEKRDDILQDIVEIFETVADASRRILDRDLSTHFTRTEPKDTTSRTEPPDAQFRLSDSTNAPSSFGRAVPWRLKSMRSSRCAISNEEELIQSCHDVLKEDAHRRFSFGVTAEDDSNTMRIWFFSRSHEFVTPAFSFSSDPSALIRVFLALAFANPEDLGYDTSMSCFIDPSGAVQYKLSVNEEVYVTTRILSDSRADCGCGRATRVWEAFREDDPHRLSVAIKDVWLPPDAPQEGAQLLQLHQQLRSIPNPDTPRSPGDYFLTALAHGFVKTSCGVDDDTITTMMRSPPPIPNCTSKKHYRIVFKEVGVAVEGLSNLADVMRALADATQALRLLHLLGFVHRDVSAGNILLVDGCGRLSDMEYLKSYTNPTKIDPKDRYIGTQEYTSPEVASSSYCYVTLAVNPLIDAPRSRSPPFRFNPLHDLESIMWLASFTILYRGQNKAPGSVFDTCFPRHSNRNTLLERMMAMGHRLLLSIPSSDALFPLANILDRVRRHLYRHYVAFEQDFDEHYFALPDAGETSAFQQLYSDIFDVHEEAVAESKGLAVAEVELEKGTSPYTPPPSATVASTVSLSRGNVDREDSPRPSKKLKSISPKTKRPSTGQSSERKHRSSKEQTPGRRSLRIAEKKKPKEPTKSLS